MPSWDMDPYMTRQTSDALSMKENTLCYAIDKSFH